MIYSSGTSTSWYIYSPVGNAFVVAIPFSSVTIASTISLFDLSITLNLAFAIATLLSLSNFIIFIFPWDLLFTTFTVASKFLALISKSYSLVSKTYSSGTSISLYL